MTTLTEARNAIYNRFIGQWGSTTQFTFDNEAFDTNDIAVDESYIRVVVRTSVGPQQTLGPVNSRIFRRTAQIIMQVFTPTDVGTASADSLGQQARAVFEGASFDGIDCFNAIVNEIGPDGAYYQMNVTVDFRYDEIK